MYWIELAYRSLLNRRLTVVLTALSIAISVMLVLSVEKIRVDAKSNFTNTLSGTDLVVGARTGALNLLLYSVFRIGDASNNISWQSYQELGGNPDVSWMVPLSLGDSHRGYRVIGTTAAYFQHYKFAREQSLSFSRGAAFEELFDTVIGSEVARRLGYAVGDKIALSHGTGVVSFSNHDDLPFTIKGLLDPTGTPVDRSLHVSLGAIEAIHQGWDNGVKLRGAKGFDPATSKPLEPEVITAALVGMKSRLKTFAFQRHVNKYSEEPLMAIVPGATLQQLWSMLRFVESTLLAIVALVACSSLLGLLTVIMAGLNERRREIALLRALGASARHVFGLLCGEAALIALLGSLLGVLFYYALLIVMSPLLLANFGVVVQVDVLPLNLIGYLLALVCFAGLLGLIPAWRAYRFALSDGLTMRT